MSITSKPCTVCGETKPLEAFWRHNTTPDGRMKVCTACHRARKRNALLRRTSTPAKPRLPQGGTQQGDAPQTSWIWEDSAACRGEDLVLFFGVDGERLEARLVREAHARGVCGGCPVRNACLDSAIATKEFGVWGGMNDDERRAERRRRMRRVNAA